MGVYGTTIYDQQWPVLKTNTSLFAGDWHGRPPLSTDAVDTDYPEILGAEAAKIVNIGGRNVLTLDDSLGEEYSTSGVAFTDLGPTPISMIGDADADDPQMWFNTQQGIIAFADFHLVGVWAEPFAYCPIIWLNRTPFSNGPERVVCALSIDGEDSYLDFYGQSWLGPDPFVSIPFPQSTYEGKRIRFKVEFKPGTILTTTPTIFGDSTDTVALDGYLRLTIIDLDTLVETVLAEFLNIDLWVSYLQETFLPFNNGMPDNNYLSGAFVGFFGLAGENERFAIESVAAASVPCSGGGTMPASADVTYSEDWRTLPIKQPDSWLTIS